MATSPFAKFANTQLIFSIATDRIVLDEYDNPTQTTERFIVTAILKPQSSNLKPQAGVDDNQSVFSGYLVEPLQLPKAIAPNSKAEIILGGRMGEFTLQPTIPNPYLAAAKITMLTEIKGVVRWFN